MTMIAQLLATVETKNGKKMMNPPSPKIEEACWLEKN
jgi:hypothetical protein